MKSIQGMESSLSVRASNAEGFKNYKLEEITK